MNRILLDTSGYRFLLKNHPDVQKSIEMADGVVVNPVIIGEILSGFAKGSSYETNKENFELFLNEKGVEILSIDQTTAHQYAFIYIHLRKSGLMVSPNDLWIAAQCDAQHNLRVITLDRDYLKIPQIMVDCFDLS